MADWLFIAAGIAFCFSPSKAARIGGVLLSAGGSLTIDDDHFTLILLLPVALIVFLSAIYDALRTKPDLNRPIALDLSRPRPAVEDFEQDA